jgi:hypothetical protein
MGDEKKAVGWGVNGGEVPCKKSVSNIDTYIRGVLTCYFPV